MVSMHNNHERELYQSYADQGREGADIVSLLQAERGIGFAEALRIVEQAGHRVRRGQNNVEVSDQSEEQGYGAMRKPVNVTLVSMLESTTREVIVARVLATLAKPSRNGSPSNVAAEEA